MITMAQRIEELRTQKGLSRPELSAALGLPKNTAEKFETGRATPTQEQQNQLADFFGVSLFYLRGESSDPTRQDSWMEGNFVDEDPLPSSQPKRKNIPSSAPASSNSSGGSLVEPFLKNKAFQEMVRTAILEVLRSPEGQEILAKALKRMQ